MYWISTFLNQTTILRTIKEGYMQTKIVKYFKLGSSTISKIVLESGNSIHGIYSWV